MLRGSDKQYACWAHGRSRNKIHRKWTTDKNTNGDEHNLPATQHEKNKSNTTNTNQQWERKIKQHKQEKQKLERRITPEVAQQYLLIKGQERLPSKGSLYINLKVPVREPGGKSHWKWLPLGAMRAPPAQNIQKLMVISLLGQPNAV